MSSRPGNFNRARAIALSALVASAASGSLAKSLLLEGWSVGAVVVLRMGIAAIVLCPPTVWLVCTRRARFKGNLMTVVLVGALGATGTAVCYFNAIRRLSVGIAMIGLYTSPVLVLVWVWLRNRKQPDFGTAVGACLAITGVAIVGLAGGGSAPPNAVGLGWALGGAACLATYFVCAGDARADAPPIFLAGASLLIATLTAGFLAVIDVLPFRVGGPEVVLSGRAVSTAVPLCVLAVVSTAYAYVASLTSVKVLGARLTSFLGLLELSAAAVMAWIVLGERLTFQQGVGGVVTALGVLLVRSDGVAAIDGDLIALTDDLSRNNLIEEDKDNDR